MSNNDDLHEEPLNKKDSTIDDVNGSEDDPVILTEKDYLAEKELENF